MKAFTQNLANLFKVKTIITLVMVISATIFVGLHYDLPDWFVALISSIVTFYFTKQTAAISEEQSNGTTE